MFVALVSRLDLIGADLAFVSMLLDVIALLVAVVIVEGAVEDELVAEVARVSDWSGLNPCEFESNAMGGE